MTSSVSKEIADFESNLLASGASLAPTLNQFLQKYLSWPYQVHGGNAIDADGVTSGQFPTLIYTATQNQTATEPLTVSADSLASVIEVVEKLEADMLQSAYDKISVAKGLRKTTNPPSPYLNTTLGVLVVRESILPIEKIAEQLHRLNQRYPSYLWLDCLVVLGRGFLGYAVQFPLESISADFLVPGKDITFGAPAYIHLFARPGQSVLNRMCSILFMHLALFSPGVRLPDHNEILAGVPQTGMTLASYQSNSKGNIVPASPDHYRGGSALAYPLLRIEDQKGKLLSHLQFRPWQDGALILLYGPLPLEGLLLYLGRVGLDAMIIKRPKGQFAGVLPITHENFKQMLTRFQSQSNMIVRPEPQPTWIMSKAYDEGTTSPFMARLFLGLVNIREQVYGEDSKQRNAFDTAYESVLINVYNARAAAKEIRELIEGHRKECAEGTCVRRLGNTIHIEKNISPQLRKQTETFLNSAGRALKNVQDVMRLLGINIGFLYQKTTSFAKGIATLRQTNPGMADYLDKTRANWSERLNKMRNALEHEGWTLARVEHREVNGVVTAVEPNVDGEPASQFADWMLERLSCFVEELVAHGLQQKMLEGISLSEIPLNERKREAPERFQPAIVTGGLPIWSISYHDKKFDET